MCVFVREKETERDPIGGRQKCILKIQGPLQMSLYSLFFNKIQVVKKK